MSVAERALRFPSAIADRTHQVGVGRVVGSDYHLFGEPATSDDFVASRPRRFIYLNQHCQLGLEALNHLNGCCWSGPLVSWCTASNKCQSNCMGSRSSLSQWETELKHVLIP